MTFIRHYLLAVQFFTRIPITGALAQWVGFSPAMLRRSAAHLPGIGWLVGAITALVFGALLAVLPAQPAAPWVAAALSTVAGVLLTGCFHEDGLADLSDGLGGSLQRERALDIMKDSRIGTFAAVALILGLISKLALLALLAQVHGLHAMWALFAAHVTSRFMPLIITRAMVHVGDTATSKSKPLADVISNGAVLVGLAWWLAAMLLVAAVYPGLAWLQGVAGAVLGMALMWRQLQTRLQGFTGDGLGATQQVCEILFYLGLLISF